MQTHRLSKMIKNPTQLDGNRPAPFVPVFLAKLLLGTPCSNRKQQFNWKAVYHIQQAGGCQQSVGMVLLAAQLARQSRAIWQPTEQGCIIALEPPTKGPKVASFKRKQQANRNHFACIQV